MFGRKRRLSGDYMQKILAEMNSIDFHPAFNVKRDQIMISC